MNNIVISIEYQEIVDAWLAYYQDIEDSGDISGKTDVTSPYLWAIDRLDDIGRFQPELCWLLILEISDRADSDLQRASLAAGPLEDLLSRYGDYFIDRIEEVVKRNGRFRELLTGVWKNTINPIVWNRIQCLCSNDLYGDDSEFA
ncbi:MAG: hypothetical protein LBV29_00765 [Azoarcus sp.]|jgi:hypothetical protein|nr:hypothetical protein [Azoarcus sp.]